MREWHLERAQLPCLILAADARLCKPNYVDDQIWELDLSSGEPAALNLQTTYGLRARQMRLYPRFGEKDLAVSQPDLFFTPPILRSFFPNFARISCAPFEGLEAVLDYWVRGSDHSGGRIRLVNAGVTGRTVRLDWVASFVAPEEGEPLAPERLEGVNILTGRAGSIRPIVFLSGGAEALSSPSTALSLEIDLLPGGETTLFWGHAACETIDDSFQLARAFASLNWEEEVGRIAMTNACELEIETGEPSWDLAFALGQTAARRLITGPTDHLPHPSFVQTRLPDQGYSLRGDGSDYDHLWNGQNVLETWHLCSQLLPASPDTATGLLENFLSTQDQDGRIDWQPSLNGKKSGMLATPMLCSLAWRIFLTSADQVWLVKIFPRLQKFLQHWFSAEHDRDQDGIPEWDHPMQTGFDENPFFAGWQDWAQGADIHDFESPSLTGMLYRECRSLIRIAREINYTASIPALEEKLDRLARSLEKSWDDDSKVYRYRDRETHQSPAGTVLTRQQGPGMILMTERTFTPEARLSVRIHRNTEGGRDPVITIEGNRADGSEQEETIHAEGLLWSLGWGTLISEQVYSHIRAIRVAGVQPEDEIVVQTVDYRHLDQTLLAPLWAGMPDPEQAGQLVRKTILQPGGFWREYGLAPCTTTPAPEAELECRSVWIPWNCMVGEGLVHYGYRNAAAELVSRMMRAVTRNLQSGGAFRKHHESETGEGIGERNAVLGLPPLDLFLNALGVRVDSIWRVHLEGRNPYPWPVVIRFRGLAIHRTLDSTTVTFPNGDSIAVDSPAPCMVEGR